MKDLADGTMSLEELSRDETLQYAKIFDEAKGSPLALMWGKILRKKIKGYYYLLAHLPEKDLKDGIAVAKISGFIQCLEMLIKTPADFSEAVEAIEDEEKEKEA